MPTRRILFRLVLMLPLVCSLLSAQTEMAAVSGRVTDLTGAVIPGAEIIVTHIETNTTFTTLTNTVGIYHVPSLKPGRYRITAQRQGFRAVVKTELVLHVQDQVAENFVLQVGSANESVTVIADAEKVQTSAAVGTVVDRQFVEQMPLNGRSFQSLISLTPGTVIAETTSNEQGQFSFNGQRTNSNYFMVDGVGANTGVFSGANLGQSAGGSLPGLSVSGGTNSLVSVDAMQEFKVQTSSYSPEYGRSPGGQISIVTRAGTNEWHGTLFEYLRNDVFDANDWFANNKGLKKPKLRQNDFGGVLGGPIIKNRTFFFASYEGLRLRQPQNAIATQVPTLAARALAPAAVRPLLEAFPQPNGRDLGNNLAEFSATYSTPTTLDAYSLRVDHSIGSRVVLFARYSDSPSETMARGGFGALSNIGVSKYRMQVLTTGMTWAITPRLNNDLRLNWTKSLGSSSYTSDDFGNATPLPDSVVSPTSVNAKSASLGVFAGSAVLWIGGNAENYQRQFNLIDTVTTQVGAHQLKFGVDLRRLTPTYGPREFGQSIYFAGGMAGALTGNVSMLVLTASDTVSASFLNFSSFAQDQWKVTPRVTLTFGTRWEVNPPPKGQDGLEIYTVTNLSDPANFAWAPKGTPIYKTKYGNFAPRVGIAYALTQQAGWETALRGGFGVFYDLGFGSAADGLSLDPYNRSKTIRNIVYPVDPTLLVPPPFSMTPVGARARAFDPDIKLPRSYQWNITVEQVLASTNMLSLSYVGSSGRELLRSERVFNPNAAFSFVNINRNTGESDYHSLQMQFQRQLSHGFQALASYTWSHAIDNASNDSSVNVPGEKLKPALDRGSADFDVRHTFSTAISYQVPRVAALGPVGSAVLGGWSLDTIYRARSAAPVNITYNRDLGFGTFAFRPDLVEGVPVYIEDPNAGGGLVFNRDAFRVPVEMRQGSLGRNLYRGFGAQQVDFGVTRVFKFTERVNLRWRTEFFNLLNHPNFGRQSGNLGSMSATSFSKNNNFGKSTLMLGRSMGTGGGSGGFDPLYQIGGPRSIQMALKVQF